MCYRIVLEEGITSARTPPQVPSHATILTLFLFTKSGASFTPGSVLLPQLSYQKWTPPAVRLIR